MAASHSQSIAANAGQAKKIRVPPALDDIDRKIVATLSNAGRLPNNALAEAVGIAPSTALARVRSLVAKGVIRGFHADVDPAALGLGIQVMIAVRLRPEARANLGSFAHLVARLPGVMNVFFLGGADDFLVHIAAADTDALRDFVAEHLSRHPDVANTVTNVIFEHVHSTLSA